MGLFDRLQHIPNPNEIKGSFGEWLTNFYAKITTDTLILHDILINGADGFTSQIDLIIIGNTGIYVIEVKMYPNAKIYGDGKKNTWYYYLGGKKYNIYSPLKQNKKHIQYLKTFLQDFGEIPYYSIIAMFCEDIKLSNINENPAAIDTIVCTSLPAMSKAFQLLSKDKPTILTDEQKQEIFHYILTNQYTGKDARIEHKEKVKEFINDQENLKAHNICPYCKSPLILRKGKFGNFYGCSNYPKCKYTQKR